MAVEWHEWIEGESLEERQERRLMGCPILDDAEREVILQLRKVTWDGDVCSKSARDSLVKRGFAVRWNGYQVVTRLGMAWIETVFPKKMAEMEHR